MTVRVSPSFLFLGYSSTSVSSNDLYLSRRFNNLYYEKTPVLFLGIPCIGFVSGGKEAVNQALPVIDMNGRLSRKGDRVAGYC